MNANTSAFEFKLRAFYEVNPNSSQLQYIPL